MLAGGTRHASRCAGWSGMEGGILEEVFNVRQGGCITLRVRLSEAFPLYDSWREGRYISRVAILV